MKYLFTITFSLLTLAQSVHAAQPLASAMREAFEYISGGSASALRTARVLPMRNAKLTERKFIFLTAGENQKFTVVISREYKPAMTEMNIDVIQKLDPATQAKIEAIPDNHLLTGYYYPHSYNLELLDNSGRKAQYIIPNLSQVDSVGKRILANLRNVDGVQMDTMGTELHFDMFNKSAELHFNPTQKSAAGLPGIIAGARKYPIGLIQDFNGSGRAAVYRLQVALPSKNTTAEEIYQILQAVADAF